MMKRDSTQEQEEDAPLKVHYFDLYGRAEAIKMALWKAGAPYKVNSVGDLFDVSDEWKELKASGKLPYGQVPALEMSDGTFLG